MSSPTHSLIFNQVQSEAIAGSELFFSGPDPDWTWLEISERIGLDTASFSSLKRLLLPNVGCLSESKFLYSLNLKIEDYLASSCIKQGALVGKRTSEQFPSFSTNILFIK